MCLEHFIMDYNTSFSTKMSMTLLYDESRGVKSFTTAKNLYACHKIHQNLSGFILLVKRGKCSLRKKIVNAQNAGAAGVFVYNENETQSFPSPSKYNFSKIAIPVSAISYRNGLKLKRLLRKNAISNGTIHLNVTFQEGMMPIESSGLVSR